MKLTTQNFYDVGQNISHDWVWQCITEYQDNPYIFIQGKISQQKLNDFATDNYEVVSLSKTALGSSVLVKIPTENCFWTYSETDDIPTTYTLLATPVSNDDGQPDWAFLINKKWTYGDITTNLLLIVILGVLFWDIFRRIFKTKFK